MRRIVLSLSVTPSIFPVFIGKTQTLSVLKTGVLEHYHNKDSVRVFGIKMILHL